MSTTVAFLRGLNVGGHRVSMDRLRSVLESNGLNNVSTFIASGNVIFDFGTGSQSKLEQMIETALEDELGYSVDTFVRRLSELKSLTGSEFVDEAEKLGWNTHVAFLKVKAGATVAGALRKLDTADDRFRVAGREFFWLRNGGLTDSTVKNSDLNKALGGVTNTMRNYNTIVRILKKFG